MRGNNVCGGEEEETRKVRHDQGMGIIFGSSSRMVTSGRVGERKGSSTGGYHDISTMEYGEN